MVRVQIPTFFFLKLAYLNSDLNKAYIYTGLMFPKSPLINSLPLFLSFFPSYFSCYLFNCRLISTMGKLKTAL